jgi:hypothetical protein
MSEETVTTSTGAEETATEATEATATEEKAFVDTFRESITDEGLRGEKMWKELEGKNADEVGRYMRELKAFAGKKGDIPKMDATEDEWNAFHMKLGRPETIDGYDFELSEEFKALVGEGQTAFYDQAMDMFKDAMFKRGVSNDGAEEFFNDYLNLIAEQHEAVAKITAERQQEAETLLKNEWGDNKEGIETGIKAMLKDKGGMSDEDLQQFEDLGLLKEPKLALALAKINSKFEDDPEMGDFMAQTNAGIMDQMHELQQKMAEEYATTGKYSEHTKAKWMQLNAKLNS